MNVYFNDQYHPCSVWKSSDGNIGNCSIDTETTLIENGSVPDYILGAAFNGDRVFYIKKESVGTFLDLNKKNNLILANASFDISVFRKVLNTDNILSGITGKIGDILILHKLLDLAEYGRVPHKTSLASLALQYLGEEINKKTVDEDGDDVRTSFSKWLHSDGSIQYQKIESIYLEYLAKDTITTLYIWRKLQERARILAFRFGVDLKKLFSHDIQLLASIALDDCSRQGLAVDQIERGKQLQSLSAKLEDVLLQLEYLGWKPGEGSLKRTQDILLDLERNLNVRLPRTEGQKISTKAEHLSAYQKSSPFVESYLKYISLQKQKEFLKHDQKTIHSKFKALVNTGRTASTSPNVQNFPRDNHARKIIIPPKGHVFLSLDFSQLELRALAQITFSMFGRSEMRNLINQGTDLHLHFAKNFANNTPTKEDRQKAKACNFGFPGGLGITQFTEYAEKTYGVLLSREEATSLRDTWFKTFPEVKKYMVSNDHQALVNSKILNQLDYPSKRYVKSSTKAWNFLGIISGSKSTKTSERPYSKTEISWAFSILGSYDFPKKHLFLDDIKKQQGSYKLKSALLDSLRYVSLSSGRVRNCVSFTQSKNTPFQGLAADGAKLGLFSLVKEGFKVANFIHDEYLICMPLEENYDDFIKRAKNLVEKEMRVFCPDVNIETSHEIMSRWQKSGDLEINDFGKLIFSESGEPYEQ